MRCPLSVWVCWVVAVPGAPLPAGAASRGQYRSAGMYLTCFLLLQSQLQSLREKGNEQSKELGDLRVALQAAQDAQSQTAAEHSREIAELHRRTEEEIQSLQLAVEERNATLHAANETEAELRSEVMQLSAALAAAFNTSQQSLQYTQQSHEEQLRAAVARAMEEGEARGRKQSSQDDVAKRDELQKRLSDTEADFRCCLRDHQAEVGRLKEDAATSAR